jgi:hypothetical protein
MQRKPQELVLDRATVRGAALQRIWLRLCERAQCVLAA